MNFKHKLFNICKFHNIHDDYARYCQRIRIFVLVNDNRNIV